MEYISGETITGFAAGNALGLVERVRLVISCAQHLQGAHTVDLLHRDICAGNILVSGTRVSPKVWIIDWGLASGADDRDIAQPNSTIVGHFAGTPEYMAPEVLRDGLIATSEGSDVLALGIVLHQLVTGTGLYDRQGACDADGRCAAARSFWGRDRHPRPLERCRIARERDRIDVANGTTDPERTSWEASLRGHLGSVLRCATHEEIIRRYGDVAEFLHDLLIVVALASPDPGPGHVETTLLRCDQLLLGLGDPWLRAAYHRRMRLDGALYAGVDALIEKNDLARARDVLSFVSPESRDSWEFGYLQRQAEPSQFVIGGD